LGGLEDTSPGGNIDSTADTSISNITPQAETPLTPEEAREAAMAPLARPWKRAAPTPPNKEGEKIIGIYNGAVMEGSQPSNFFDRNFSQRACRGGW
jgi:hypothetical protein